MQCCLLRVKMLGGRSTITEIVTHSDRAYQLYCIIERQRNILHVAPQLPVDHALAKPFPRAPALNPHPSAVASVISSGGKDPRKRSGGSCHIGDSSKVRLAGVNAIIEV